MASIDVEANEATLSTTTARDSPTDNIRLKGLKILTLDGGAMQGLSTLLILNELMDAIAANDGNKKGKPRPCEVFDMIGGIGIGGWLALLLGRFNLDIPTCIKAYIEIVQSTIPVSKRQKFRLRSHNANYDQSCLLEEIDHLTEKYNTGEYMLYENKPWPRCQFAFAAAAEKHCSGSEPKYQIFRTYERGKGTKSRPGPEARTCLIRDAFASTSAAKYMFNSFSVSNVKFSDSGFPRSHNITNLAVDEAQSLWDFPVPFSVVVNIGPGTPTSSDVHKLGGPLAKMFSFGRRNPTDESKPLVEALAMRRAETKRAEHEVSRNSGDSKESYTLTPAKQKNSESPATKRERQFQGAIRDRLQADYPPEEGMTSDQKYLYFRLGPNEAPKRTAVNDVLVADIAYKETLAYLDRKRPIFDEVASRCRDGTPRMPAFDQTTNRIVAL